MAEALTLADLKIDLLEVVCARCDRCGRYRVQRLVAEHGPSMPLPDLRLVLSADCPNAKAASLQDRCDVRFPALVGSDK